ncbi:MAG: DUF554 family protein [Clostridia bacterium]|nr:DUF554 family protein [Clostridia bacterium]
MDTILHILASLWDFVGRAVISSFPILDTLFVIGAGCLGLLLYKRIRPEIKEIIIKCLGIGVILFAVSELWNSFFVLQEGRFEAEGSFLAIIALLIGWLFGEALALDRLLGRLGLVIHRIFEDKEPTAAKGKGKRAEPSPEEVALLTLRREERAKGFLVAVTLCSFSSLVFTHFLEGRMTNDPIPMLIKLAFDFVLVFGLSSVYGSGVPFAGAFVLLNQAELGLAYSIFGDFFTPKLMGQLSLVGGAILLAGGICLCLGKRFRAANLIPALLIPILYTGVMDKIEEAVEAALEKKEK